MLWCLLLAACCSLGERTLHLSLLRASRPGPVLCHPWCTLAALVCSHWMPLELEEFLVFDGFCSPLLTCFTFVSCFDHDWPLSKLLAVDFLVVLKLDMSSKAFKARTSLDAKDWAPRYTETLYETVLARSLPHSCRLNLFYLNLPLKDAERLSRSVKSISRHK